MNIFDEQFCEYIESLILKEVFSDGVLIADTKGIIRYMNTYNKEIFFFNHREAVGKHILQLYPDVNPENSTLLNALKGIPTLGRQTTQTAFNGQTCIFYEHTIPLKVAGKIIGAVSSAKFAASYRRELSIKPPELNQPKQFYEISDIIGSSLIVQHLKEQLRSVSKTSSSVLLCGETGTGKELAAQSIHSASKRREKYFISQNCSAIPLNLLEGLLFGTTKGSFTGAEDKAGIFEIADGGTIFLDEVNSMDMNMQTKILKVIEEKKVTRLGSNKAIPVDVRIISAMNEDPLTCIEQNRFRADLYYRLSTVQIKMPTLKERLEDLPLLIQYYIDYYNKEMGKSIKGVSNQVLEALTAYDWPGNVRELRNVIESAFNFAGDEYIDYEHLPASLSSKRGQILINRERKDFSFPVVCKGRTLTESVEAYEKNCIENEIQMTNSLSELASNLGISRQSLSYKLKKYQIKLPWAT